MTSSGRSPMRIGLLRFGEIGRIVGPGLVERGHPSVSFYDPFLSDAQKILAETKGLRVCGSLAETCAGSDLILGFTPGSQSLLSAESLAPLIGENHVFVDVASASPRIKRQVFERLAPTGALIGDAVIVGSVSQGLALSILACGPAAVSMAAQLSPFGMAIQEIEGPCGTAASIKIIRSVAMKGFGMLVFEALSAARRYGVEKDVLATLNESFARPFDSYVDRLVAGSLYHAVRRHEEVRMAAETLRDVDVKPLMTDATVARFAELARLANDPDNRSAINELQGETWQASVDWVSARMTATT